MKITVVKCKLGITITLDYFINICLWRVTPAKANGCQTKFLFTFFFLKQIEAEKCIKKKYNNKTYK